MKVLQLNVDNILQSGLDLDHECRVKDKTYQGEHSERKENRSISKCLTDVYKERNTYPSRKPSCHLGPSDLLFSGNLRNVRPHGRDQGSSVEPHKDHDQRYDGPKSVRKSVCQLVADPNPNTAQTHAQVPNQN